VRITPTQIPDVLIIDLECFEDERGVFVRHWDSSAWEAAGIGPFVQDNLSTSAPRVLRGLHFQRVSPQGKLVSVMSGAIYDVAVDIRRGSSTYGQWIGVELKAGEHRQLWVPPGFAHGFCVTSGPATIHYRCTTTYRPDEQGGLAWDDPQLAIDWPIQEPILSSRDRALPRLGEH